MSIVGTRPPLISETNLYEPHHKVVDRFFRNIERFYREYIDKNFEEKLNNLILRDSDGEEAVINISELYADLLQRSIEESVSFEEKQKQDKVKEMMDALYDIEDIYEWIDYVRKMGINQVFS